MYENYQKCICFTYNDLLNRKNIEVKFKITIDNDVMDDLYLLFAKIILQKLILMDCAVDLAQEEDPNVDKFMMAGEVFKMGQILGQWKKRKLILTDRI